MFHYLNRFPHLRQPDSMECGATCLRIIALHYGKTYSAERMRQLCDISHNGVSMLCMRHAAEEMGFSTVCGKMTVENLIAQRPFPCILHWNQNHFVVLYDVKKRGSSYEFYISDPARCRLKIDETHFREAWTGSTDAGGKGILMAMEPSEEFYKIKEDSSTGKSLAFIWKFLRTYRHLFGQLALGILIAAALQLVFPFLTQAIVDKGIHQKNFNFILLILFGQLMLVAGSTAVEFIRRWLLLHISTRVNISLLSAFFLKLMKLPMAFFDTKLRGDILQRIQDHRRLEGFMTAESLMTAFAVFTVVVLGGVLLYYNWVIFLVFLSGSLLYVVWISIFLYKRKAVDYEFFDLQAKSQNKAMQILEGMQDIKLQNCERRQRWEWEDTQADLFDATVVSTKLQQKQEAGSKLINEVKNIVITVMTAALVIDGELTLGMMLSIQYIVGQLNVPVDQLVRFIYSWQDVQIGIERINEIHHKPEENLERPVAAIPEKSDILISGLSFSYSGMGNKRVLDNINLTIPAEKTTAIVGASGSGKTTLIKLLLGFYLPVEGTITVGGEDLRKINLDYWRSRCGTVMQDGYIFSDSVARNIAMDNEEVDMARVEESARLANVTEIISTMPHGFGTMIGTDGQGLSQGQKQRVLIARAIYKSPQFLFFDEATNSLDTGNEKRISENLAEFSKGRTMVIVAHRLSTVRNADNIVVLDKGKIGEQGTHDELVARRGVYYELIRNQLELGKE